MARDRAAAAQGGRHLQRVRLVGRGGVSCARSSPRCLRALPVSLLRICGGIALGIQYACMRCRANQDLAAIYVAALHAARVTRQIAAVSHEQGCTHAACRPHATPLPPRRYPAATPDLHMGALAVPGRGIRHGRVNLAMHRACASRVLVGRVLLLPAARALQAPRVRCFPIAGCLPRSMNALVGIRRCMRAVLPDVVAEGDEKQQNSQQDQGRSHSQGQLWANVFKDRAGVGVRDDMTRR